jgi:hypothetical protein
VNPEVKALLDIASLANPEILNKEVFTRILYLQLLSGIDIKINVYTQMATIHNIVDEVVRKLY